jgi:hypothetical protein
MRLVPQAAHGDADHAFGDVDPLFQSQTNKSPGGLDYRMPKSSTLGSTTTPFLITNRSHIFFM